MKVRQHMTFAVTFKNVDAADPRWLNETELTFGGIWYDEDEGEPKDVAIMHCAFNVVHADEIVKELGKVRPIPKTFRLIDMHTPSDQGMN